MRITLMGYMGCGKSTVGKRLSRALDYTFIDLDAEIERVESQTIEAIFQQKGEAYFRQIESQLLLEVLERDNNMVIATGGGTPVFGNNINQINGHSVSVYLEMPVGSLVNRVQSAKKVRPLLAGLKGVELMAFITNNLAERKPYYEQANIIVPAVSLDYADLIDRLVAYSNGKIK